MPNAILNGISIDYTTAGEGPPVLLICGTGQPADLWFAQVADLVAAGHRVITFDNRGCGRSAAPPAPYRVADMAADTAALIEYLGLGPCDVIGYSLGGYIAQQLAVTCPALVRRLVLVAGVGAAPAYALARARAAVDLALALDPLPSSFDVADLLLSLHSMAQLQNDDDAVKVTISLIEAGGPWTNPGRLGQYQADLAWLQDTAIWTGSATSIPLPGHGIRTRLLVPAAGRAGSSRAHGRLPVRRTERPGPRRPPAGRRPGQPHPRRVPRDRSAHPTRRGDSA